MKGKSELNIKERALESMKSFQNIEPDFVMGWLGGLTELEQKIVSNIYQLNKAVTIKEVMNDLVSYTYYGNFLGEPNIGIFPYKSYFDLDQKLILKLEHIDYPRILDELKKTYKFPSFRRIDNSVQDLINMGIVFARKGKLENAKIKGLYYLNPVVRSQLDKLKELNQDNSEDNS